MNIIIFGPNGSGKGTQGELIKHVNSAASRISRSKAQFSVNTLAVARELGKKQKLYRQGRPCSGRHYHTHGSGNPENKGQERLAARWFSPQYGPGRKTVGKPCRRDGIKLDYVVEIKLPRQNSQRQGSWAGASARPTITANNVKHRCHQAPLATNAGVCGGDLSTRSDDQDEAAISKRHDIYYDEKWHTGSCRFIFTNWPTKARPNTSSLTEPAQSIPFAKTAFTATEVSWRAAVPWAAAFRGLLWPFWFRAARVI